MKFSCLFHCIQQRRRTTKRPKMSTRVLVSVCGASAVLGFFCGLYVSRKWTKKPKAEGERVNSLPPFNWYLLINFWLDGLVALFYFYTPTHTLIASYLPVSCSPSFPSSRHRCFKEVNPLFWVEVSWRHCSGFCRGRNREGWIADRTLFLNLAGSLFALLVWLVNLGMQNIGVLKFLASVLVFS